MVDHAITWSTGKQKPGPFERKGRMVGRVPGRQDRTKRPAVAGNRGAVDQSQVRRKVGVGAGEPADLTGAQGPGRAMRPFGADQRAGRLL